MRVFFSGCGTLVVAMLVCVGSTTSVYAAIIDDDNADRAVYDDGWDNFDDGSTNPDGLGGWVFGGSVAASDATVGTSTFNGGLSSIDSPNRSFTLIDSGDSDAFIEVFRFLDGGDLSVGQVFSFDMDVNFRNGFKGIQVRDTNDSTVIFKFEVGLDDYIVTAATGSGSIGNAYSDDTQFHVELTQTSAGGGDWSITRSGGVADSDSGTYAGAVSSFFLYTFLAGQTNPDAIHYNNFAVTPEPASLVLMGLGVGAMLSYRRRV